MWHSDASGRYSDVGARSASGTSLQFLRGYQRTDATGTAQFMTIFPGWYGGRTAHIHFKIRLAAPSGSAARTQEFTSQLYFEDALQDRVFATAPYIRRGTRDMHNTDDFLYRSGGKQLLFELQTGWSRDTQRYSTSACRCRREFIRAVTNERTVRMNSDLQHAHLQLASFLRTRECIWMLPTSK